MLRKDEISDAAVRKRRWARAGPIRSHFNAEGSALSLVKTDRLARFEMKNSWVLAGFNV